MIDGNAAEAIDTGSEVADVAPVADAAGSAPAEYGDRAPLPSGDAASPSYDAAPIHWKRDVAEKHWGRLDPELRAYLHQRELDAQRLVSKHAAALERFKPYDGIDSVVAQYAPYFPAGYSGLNAIRPLLEAQRLINERPVDAISYLMQQTGVDPFSLLPPEAQQYVGRLQEQMRTAQEKEVGRMLDDFKKDKPHYDHIRQDVIQEIAAIRQGAPGLSHQQVLKLAYDTVMERTGMGQKLAAERERAERLKREEEAAKRAEEAKRSAKVNVRSHSAGFRAPKTMDETLEELGRVAYGT